jgi:hypothetical protein
MARQLQQHVELGSVHEIPAEQLAAELTGQELHGGLSVVTFILTPS